MLNFKSINQNDMSVRNSKKRAEKWIPLLLFIHLCLSRIFARSWREPKITSTSLKYCKCRLFNSLTFIGKQLCDHNRKWRDYRCSDGRHLSSEDNLAQKSKKELPQNKPTHTSSLEKNGLVISSQMILSSHIILISHNEEKIF